MRRFSMSLAPTEKQLINQCQTYDLAESQRLRRALLAREAGLPPEEFARPFPGNTVTITHNHAEGSDMLKKLLPVLLSGLLGAGGAGALVLATRTAAPSPSVPLTSPVTPATQAPPAPLDLRVKWWVENGQVKTSVDPVTPSPSAK
jgi:hypothetical protein